MEKIHKQIHSYLLHGMINHADIASYIRQYICNSLAEKDQNVPIHDH